MSRKLITILALIVILLGMAAVNLPVKDVKKVTEVEPTEVVTVDTTATADVVEINQVWSRVENIENPFSEPEVFTVKVVDLKCDYVLYEFIDSSTKSLVGHKLSCTVKTFTSLYDLDPK